MIVDSNIDVVEDMSYAGPSTSYILMKILFKQ